MTIEKAYSIARKYIDPIEIDYCINVKSGWMFIGANLVQPLYITEKSIKGLNASVESDADMIKIAYEKIKNKDFY